MESEYMYEPPPSLWKFIETHTPRSELCEIRRLLGDFLVEENIDLRSEVETLLEIWRELQGEATDGAASTPLQLPEPPEIRDRLKQEIRFFVDNIKEKSGAQSVEAKRVLQSCDSKIIDYAFEEEAGSNSIDSGRETPILPSPLTSRIAKPADNSWNTDIRSRLSLGTIDDIVARLQKEIADENQRLKEDVDFLQICLDEENQSGKTVQLPAPSLADLRTQRSYLERQFLNKDDFSTPSQKLPVLASSTRGRMAKPSPPSSGKKMLPLKADHSAVVNTREISERLSHPAECKRRNCSAHSKDGQHKAIPHKHPKPPQKAKPNVVIAKSQPSANDNSRKVNPEFHLPLHKINSEEDSDYHSIASCGDTDRSGVPIGQQDSRPPSGVSVSSINIEAGSRPDSGDSGRRPSTADRLRRIVLECREDT